MKMTISSLIIMIALFAGFSGCEKEDEGENLDQSGEVALYLTDAPIDDTSITGVYITITGLQYHKQNNSWETFEEFEGPQKFNLLELQDSIRELLGNFELEAGQYNQLRFMLDAAERGQGPPTSPGCYLEYENGDTEPLFVPSGAQSGYKATGAFTVPSNDMVELTADFDVRKSVIRPGRGDTFILRPTIRLVANNEAGTIAGGVSGMSEDSSHIVIYAYEDDTYTADEAMEPDTAGNRFLQAVTSDVVNEEHRYQLLYLAPKTYDLIVTRNLDGEFKEVLGGVEDVAVESKKTTSQPIDLSDLSSL